MISMAEYYIVLDQREVGPEVQKLIEIQRRCGCATQLAEGGWKIDNASEQDQKAWFAAFERAMDLDFPPSEDDECCCEE